MVVRIFCITFAPVNIKDIRVMRKESLNPEQVLNGKKTFYAKRYQNNGYFPVTKYVWHEDKQAWEQFVQKGNVWHSWGVAYETPVELNGAAITNISWWEYIFTHNDYLLSYNEMKDNHNFNDK